MKNLKTVAFMPIRLNSKRVKQKSVRDFGGRPLFCWALERLDQLGIAVYIYCSAVDEIRGHLDFRPRNIAIEKRPIALDSDQTKGIEIYKAFAEAVDADVYLLAHATSPFITTNTYKVALDAVQSGNHDSALTVKRIQSFCWFSGSPLNFSLPRVQTQLLQPVFVETSAVYAYTKPILGLGDRSSLNPKLIELTSPEDEDIDTEDDFSRCLNFL